MIKRLLVTKIVNASIEK